MLTNTAYAEKLDTCVPARRRRHLPRLVKSDRPRAIDRYIDYFGERPARLRLGHEVR